MIKVSLNKGKWAFRQTLTAGWASGYNATIGLGAPLKFVAAGSPTGDTGPTFAISDGQVVDAIFDGARWVDSLGRVTIRPRWDAGTVSSTPVSVHYLRTDPDAVYEVPASAQFHAGSVGSYCGLTNINGVEAGSGLSTCALDPTTLQATPSVTSGGVTTYYPFLIVDVSAENRAVSIVSGEAKKDWSFDSTYGQKMLVKAAAVSKVPA